MPLTASAASGILLSSLIRVQRPNENSAPKICIFRLPPKVEAHKYLCMPALLGPPAGAGKPKEKLLQQVRDVLRLKSLQGRRSRPAPDGGSRERLPCNCASS